MLPTNSTNWNIESMRFTAFINGQLNPSMLEAWLEQASENSPSQVNKAPNSFSGVSRRSTTGFLRTIWKGDRLDVTISPENPLDTIQTIASISEADSLLGWFVQQIPEIKELPPIDRLAFGLILVIPVASQSQGTEILSENIASLKLKPSARDLIYRVNYPHESQVSRGVSLNRLATWSVSNIQIMEFRLNPDGSQGQKVVSEGELAARLELDINTDKESKLGANSELLRSLLDELTKIALDVARSGEATLLQ